MEVKIPKAKLNYRISEHVNKSGGSFQESIQGFCKLIYTWGISYLRYVAGKSEMAYWISIHRYMTHYTDMSKEQLIFFKIKEHIHYSQSYMHKVILSTGTRILR